MRGIPAGVRMSIVGLALLGAGLRAQTAPAAPEPGSAASVAAPAPAPQAAQSTAGPFGAPPPAGAATLICCGYGPVTLALTPGQHFRRFAASLFEFDTLYMPLVTVVPSQLLTKHEGYADGAGGFADAYKVDVLDEADGKFIRHYAFPAMFHQDELYDPLGSQASLAARVRHALRHILVTESQDHTRYEFNAEGLPAAAVAAITEIPFQPASQRGVSATLGNFGSIAGFRILGDLITEFSPEIFRLVP